MTIKLHGITWDHTRGYQPLADSIVPYTSKDNVEIYWEKRSLKDFGDVPVDVLAEKYDLMIIDHPHAGLASKTGCLLPLDEWISTETMATLAGQSAGPSHISYHFEGHQWALAIDTAMQSSVYRPDLLDSPLPKTWDEVIQLGQNLQGTGQWIAIPLVPTDCTCCFITLCANLGSPPGQNDKLVDETIGLKALDYLIAMQTVAHPESLNWNPIWMMDHMSQADDVVYCPLSFCYTNYSRDAYSAHLLQFGNIPGVKGSLLGGAGFAVSAQCQYPEAACEYGVWLCSADIQRGLYVESGGQPGNIVAWQDDHANAITNNFFRNTLDTMMQSYLRPRHNGFVDFQIEAGIIIHNMLRDATDPKKCLEKLMKLFDDTKQ